MHLKHGENYYERDLGGVWRQNQECKESDIKKRIQEIGKGKKGEE